MCMLEIFIIIIICLFVYLFLFYIFSECSLQCINGMRNDETCQCMCDQPWMGNTCAGMKVKQLLCSGRLNVTLFTSFHIKYISIPQ